MSVIIGIDPDSKGHGVAIYKDGKLKELQNMTLAQIVVYTLPNIPNDTVFHIEDVSSNSYVHRQRTDRARNTNVAQKMAWGVGKCAQSEIELRRVLEVMGFEYVMHKRGSVWKKAKSKKQFELVTGWTGRSNEDTRSAAYFGWLGLK